MAGQRVKMYVNTIVAADDMYEDGMLEELRKESSKDNLQALEEVIGGWATKGKSYKGYIRRLYTQRENITVKDKLLMCGNRVLIPDIIKNKLLYMIHRGHQSSGKCIERSRGSVW